MRPPQASARDAAANTAASGQFQQAVAHRFAGIADRVGSSLSAGHIAFVWRICARDDSGAQVAGHADSCHPHTSRRTADEDGFTGAQLCSRHRCVVRSCGDPRTSTRAACLAVRLVRGRPRRDAPRHRSTRARAEFVPVRLARGSVASDYPWSLVMHRRGDRAVLFKAGKHLARQIPGAVWRPLDGVDHFWFCGYGALAILAIEAFVTR